MLWIAKVLSGIGRKAQLPWKRSKSSWQKFIAYTKVGSIIIFLNSWKRVLGGMGILLLGIGYYGLLPTPLFKDPVSTVLFSQKGELLGARIAPDGQWRFPLIDSVPDNFQRSLITFEDKRFFSHIGVDPLATGRAMVQNIRQGRVVSGGSTLSMQVIRLARKGRPRTIWEKIMESLMATRLELRHSKQEILAMYASHAPFGGNVVGLEAASWKYFGRMPDQLSWAEAATLAVLPNAPGLIHPGKNRDALARKRNRLLDRLYQTKVLDSLSWILAKSESLPQSPLPLPSYAPHLLENLHAAQAIKPGVSARLLSSLDKKLQVRSTEIVQRYHRDLRNNGVYNAAALVAEISTGKVKVYVGNTQAEDTPRKHGHAVDIIQAPRSTGSILKPFLYAAMLSDGELLPHSLVPDIPSFYQGYTPVNYTEDYMGAVPAHQALARSLNVPAVRMLQEYGIPRFQERLEQLGMRTLHRNPGDYGLTLILGGAEATLWDLCGIYAGMARSLGEFYRLNGQYATNAYRPLTMLMEKMPPDSVATQPQGILSASAIWHTFEAMQEVTRPTYEKYWQQFSSSQRVAWKTGTSFGNRDAWAIGCTRNYVVGVWVGNADGEGRPGLTGIGAAAPILFDLVNILPRSTAWFEPPYAEMYQAEICEHSGYLAGPHCPIRLDWIPKAGEQTLPCPFHKMLWVDTTQSYQVTAECATLHGRMQTNWFSLPPIQAHYYKIHHPTYKGIPPYREDCKPLLQNSFNPMALIYPQHYARIYVPVELDGQPGRTVFELTHQNPNAKVHWHLDKVYIGSTIGVHEMALNPPPGLHSLTWVDQYGESLVREFEILIRS